MLSALVLIEQTKGVYYERSWKLRKKINFGAEILKRRDISKLSHVTGLKLTWSKKKLQIFEKRISVRFLKVSNQTVARKAVWMAP